MTNVKLYLGDPNGLLGDGLLPPGEKKRKRTSIAAPEKRSLEVRKVKRG